MIYRFLADAVLVVHLVFVSFVVLGGLLVLRWRVFVWLHLPTLVWGILVQCFFWKCPLTPLENRLRRLGGEAGYTGGFIEHYISLLLYPDISLWFQATLGLVLVSINLTVYSSIFARRSQAVSTRLG